MLWFRNIVSCLSDKKKETDFAFVDFDLTPVSALFEDWFPDVTESFSALKLYIYFTA